MKRVDWILNVLLGIALVALVAARFALRDDAADEARLSEIETRIRALESSKPSVEPEAILGEIRRIEASLAEVGEKLRGLREKAAGSDAEGRTR